MRRSRLLLQDILGWLACGLILVGVLLGVNYARPRQIGVSPHVCNFFRCPQHDTGVLTQHE